MSCVRIPHSASEVSRNSFIFLTEEGALLPVIDPGLKGLPFRPGFLLPVGKPGLKGDPNWE